MAEFTSDVDTQLPLLPADVTSLEDAREEIAKLYVAVHILHKELATIKTRLTTAGIA